MNSNEPASEEIPLVGGNVRSVVRIGTSVRREPSPVSSTIQHLMRHTRGLGVLHVPMPMGFDAHGREILEYIEGEVPHEQPAWLWHESILVEAASWLRSWHDATAELCSANLTWGFPTHEPAETICHNDFAPYNAVFRERRLVGVIDYDFCAPGPRIRDLAWSVYRFVPVQPPVDALAHDDQQERSPFPIEETLRRLQRFLEIYHGSDPLPGIHTTSLLSAMVCRLDEVAAWTDKHVIHTGKQELSNHARMYRGHAAWIREQLLAGPGVVSFMREPDERSP